jgi:hypothetical protein
VNLIKIFLWKTTFPISTKLGRIVPWVKGFQSCSKNFIPCRNLVAMATKRNYKNTFKKSSCKDPKGIKLRYFA